MVQASNRKLRAAEPSLLRGRCQRLLVYKRRKNMAQKRIIDKRIKEKFLIDDAYLNGMAKKCGWQATLVYLCLCRHANKGQECFPSINLMQEKLAIGRNTILKGIKNLEKFNIIEVIRDNKKFGNFEKQNNTYILIDKSEWKEYEVPVRDTDEVPVRTQRSPCGGLSEVPVEDYKETHIKETHIRSRENKFSPPSLNEIKIYCEERKNNVNPESFLNFYEMKGWLVGKTRMKNWQAAVRTWENRDNTKVGSNEKAIIPSYAKGWVK